MLTSTITSAVAPKPTARACLLFAIMSTDWRFVFAWELPPTLSSTISV